MKIFQSDKWVYYSVDNFVAFDNDNFGKWMFFFDNVTYAEQICRLAVQSGVCKRAKHANDAGGICGFYTNADDIATHETILRFMLSNNLIRKTKSGKYFDISFKYEEENPDNTARTPLKLSDFVDLESGQFKPVYIQQRIC